jgi:hypothetical protein
MEALDMKGYRLEVTLPREISKKLEALRREMQKGMKRRVTKSEIALHAIKKFLGQVSE